MKTSYLFIAIILCNAVGLFATARFVKTLMLALSGAIALYGLIRLLG
ncbi:hypothetical protein KIK84_00645 [Curvibacter sp. CHRR-16]|nr:hypothetical protein [Curvibacter sp. CHRR-16]MBT0568819.1 hypothetical protein [Curvibacter sp. CHRR-16]